MAVDTQAKRFAMLGFATTLISLAVVDAAVSTEDRVSFLGLYNGITLGEPVEIVGGGGYNGMSYVGGRMHSFQRRGLR